MHAKAKKKNPGFGIFGDLLGPGSLALSHLIIFSNSKKKKKDSEGGRRAGGGDHEDQRGKEKELTWIRENNAVDIYITKPSRSQFR
jgi:hypothetical protein